MPVDCVEDPDRDHVAHLELDFGRLNLLSPAAIAELREAPDLVPERASVVTLRAAGDRKSTRLNSSHRSLSRMPSSA